MKQSIHTARDNSVFGEIIINFPSAMLVKPQDASPVVTVLDEYAMSPCVCTVDS